MTDQFQLEFWKAAVGAAFSAGATAFENSLNDPELENWIKLHDVFFAVYREPQSPNGFHLVCIHGYERLIAPPDSGNFRMNAIPCVDRVAAEQLLNKYGDPSWPSQFDNTKPKTN